MNRRLLTILLVAFIIAAGASYVVWRLVRSTAGGAPAEVTQVIVANRDMGLGTIVKDGDLGSAKWVGLVPKGIATRKEDVVNRGVISMLYAGEPIADSRLAKPGAGGGMAATIPPGKRALAVKVDQVVGLAGFVLPGMTVDVLITGNPPGAPAVEGARTKTILQNVGVLSAGQNIQKDAEGKPVQVTVVNLLVTPEQAEVLSLASTESRIQLVLRNPLDTEESKTTGRSLSSLFTEQKPQAAASSTPQPRRAVAVVKPPAPAKPVAPPPPAQYVIDVINGARKEQTKFAKPEEAKQ
jgi:pilus assembly protein CpaB